MKTEHTSVAELRLFELPVQYGSDSQALQLTPLQFFPPLTLATYNGFKFHTFESHDKTRTEYSGFIPILPKSLNSSQQCLQLPEIDYEIATEDEYALLDAENCSKEASGSEEDQEDEPRSDDNDFMVDDSYASDTEEDPSFFRRKKTQVDLQTAVRLQVILMADDPQKAKEYKMIKLNGLLEDV